METAVQPHPPTTRGPKVPVAVLAVGLTLAYLPVYLPWLLRQVGVDLGWGPAGVLVWNWLAVALLALHVWRVERLDAASLRLVRPTRRDIEWAGWLGGAAVGWNWLSTQLLPATPAPEGGGADALVALGPLLALGLVLATAVTEVVLWRGYVVERLGAWTGPLVAAGVGWRSSPRPICPSSGPGGWSASCPARSSSTCCCCGGATCGPACCATSSATCRSSSWRSSPRVVRLDET